MTPAQMQILNMLVPMPCTDPTWNGSEREREAVDALMEVWGKDDLPPECRADYAETRAYVLGYSAFMGEPATVEEAEREALNYAITMMFRYQKGTQFMGDGNA